MKPGPQSRASSTRGKEAAIRAPAKRNSLPLWLTAAFLAGIGIATLSGQLPPAVAGIYLFASCISFVAYARDKSAARNDRWRTREQTLHLFALLGGWPGALAAQRWLRHKSSKPSFQIVFWLTMLLNCAALAWLITSPDAAELRALLGAM